MFLVVQEKKTMNKRKEEFDLAGLGAAVAVAVVATVSKKVIEYLTKD